MIKQAFMRFRGGNAFIISLGIFLTTWLAARCVWTFDPDNGWLNLILSIEASVTTSLLVDLQFKQDAMIRQILDQILATEKRIEQDILEDHKP